MKCKFCEREFTHAGGLNLHQRACELKFYRSQQKEKESVSRETTNKHEHDFRLLDRSKVNENSAYNAGYKEVCKECLELR